MLAEFSVTPIGENVHVSKEVSKAIKIVKDSGLDYQVTAMATIIEGNREVVMKVIERAHQAVLEGNERVSTRIMLDEFRHESTGRIRSKVMQVEKELGTALKK